MNLAVHGQSKTAPHTGCGLNKVVHHVLTMVGCWCQAQTLRATGNCWVVDGLDVDAKVIYKQIGGFCAFSSITNL